MTRTCRITVTSLSRSGPKQRVIHLGYSPTIHCAWKYLTPVSAVNGRKQLSQYTETLA
ncbi:hypothetical protein SERLA73DRAFT_133342 [Serpula lacrymans var. lacrymans S7.3]|uniref:Uncharacterized protein n=1 Tax=Serpula lacrymans var. lacrymans (strain S7.3) TaxID=936435 RepID=F8PR72_SERL3|nr:hypothetical protein SERLA73DRAFT_133342 [Serpula lacrymans var. lacrymans S7.3]